MLQVGQASSIIEEAVRVIVLATIAFFFAFAATPMWVRVLERWGMRKQIRTAKHAPVFNTFHERKGGTLTGGGLIVWTTVVGLAILFWALSIVFDGTWDYFNFVNRSETYLPLTALLVAAILGLVDDWYGVLKIGPNGGGLKIRHKMFLYLFLAAIGAWWFYFKLGRTALSIPFFGEFEVGVGYLLFFIFIVVATAFSANETDGLDGLLGGVSLFAYLALTAVAFAAGLYHLAAFGGTVVGSLLAFLWFNIYPARFFMGDTGSMSLGITIGVIAMLTNTALLLPFFAFILVIESLSVIIQMTSRKMLGRKAFRSTPIHHHFEAIGWPESQITMRFWIVSAVSCALGLALFFLARFS